MTCAHPPEAPARPMAAPRPQLAALGLGMAVALAGIAVLAWPLRQAVYLSVAPAMTGSPATAAVARAVAAWGPLPLVALAAVLAVVTGLRDRGAFWYLAAGGLGVVAAYLLSEGLKVLVAQERPCRVWEVHTALSCPALGDWSWPSNHSVVAAAFATACIIAVPRTAGLAVPAALLASLARLAAGVHYLHDVPAGLALGTAVVVVVVLVLRRAIRSWWPAPSGPGRSGPPGCAPR